MRETWHRTTTRKRAVCFYLCHLKFAWCMLPQRGMRMCVHQQIFCTEPLSTNLCTENVPHAAWLVPECLDDCWSHTLSVLLFGARLSAMSSFLAPDSQVWFGSWNGAELLHSATLNHICKVFAKRATFPDCIQKVEPDCYSVVWGLLFVPITIQLID